MNNTTTTQRLTPASVINGTVSDLLRTYKKEADNNPDIFSTDAMVVIVSIQGDGVGTTFLPPDPDFCLGNAGGWFDKTAEVMDKSGLCAALAIRLIAESGVEGKDGTLTQFVLAFSDFYNFAIDTADELVHTNTEPSIGLWGTTSRQVCCVMTDEGPSQTWLLAYNQQTSRKDRRSGDPRKRAGQGNWLPPVPSFPFELLQHKVVA